MFIGRKRELEFLSNTYNKEGFDFIPVYGRRRVGKTELIHRFIEGKKYIVYSAIEQSATLSLKQFSKIINDFFNLPYQVKFEDWDQMFAFIGGQSIEGKLIIVIDEYPYLAKQSPELSSILQKHMDHTFKNSNVLFILCGSSMSFMENQVLGYQSPLYGRRTGQIKLSPLSYDEAAQFLPKGTNEEKFLLYSVCGGIPQYLKMLTSYEDLETGIVQSFFEPTGHLYEEPENLLKQELREPTNYFSIITAIAAGKNKSNEIAAMAGMENTSVAKYLKSLIDLGIIEKIAPMDKNPRKRGIYRICDNCFRFWFRFVFTNKTGIEFGIGKDLWKRIKLEELPTYQGPIFEQIALVYLMKNELFKGVRLNAIGSWWGNNPIEKKEEEIDLVGVSYEGPYIIGECKWRQELVKQKVLSDLQRKAALLTFAEDKYYCLFSKTGFSEALIEEAKSDKKLALVSLDDMYSVSRQRLWNDVP